MERYLKMLYGKLENESAGKAWEKSIDYSDSNLSLDDKIILKNLSKMLGKTDLDGQISEIELVNEFLNMQIREAEEEKIKNEKIYKTLGGIVGLTLIIILI